MIPSSEEDEEEEEEEAAACRLRLEGVLGQPVELEVVGRRGESSEGVADDLSSGGLARLPTGTFKEEPVAYVLDLDRLTVGRDVREGVDVDVDGIGVGMDRLTVLVLVGRAYLSPPGVEKKSMAVTGTDYYMIIQTRGGIVIDCRADHLQVFRGSLRDGRIPEKVNR